MVDDQLERELVKLSNIKEYSTGSVEGRLETINLHGKEKKFIVYPFVGPIKIPCNVPAYLIEKAKLALDRRVIVFGRKHYHPFDDFPHFIDAEDIEIVDAEPLDIHATRGIMGSGDLTCWPVKLPAAQRNVGNSAPEESHQARRLLDLIVY